MVSFTVYYCIDDFLKKRGSTLFKPITPSDVKIGLDRFKCGVNRILKKNALIFGSKKYICFV